VANLNTAAELLLGDAYISMKSTVKAAGNGDTYAQGILVGAIAAAVITKKGGGKNAKHANSKAKITAKTKYETAKTKLNELKSQPNKTKEIKKIIKKQEGQVKKLKKDADFNGENHNQNSKGNR